MGTIETIRVHGGALSVRVMGQGPTILFVHGFPLDHQMWTGQLPLAARFRCIMPDLRGFGASTAEFGDILSMSQFAEDLQAVMETLSRDENICVCGLSMGGYVAFELWQRCADRISHLILCDSRAAADTMEVARGRELAAQKISAEGIGELVAGMMSKLFGSAASADCRQSAKRIMQSTSAAACSAALLGMAQRSDFTSRLPEIRVPTLALCGNQDAITPPDEMRQMASRLPFGKFTEVDEAGHLAPWEQPQQVNAHIERFISCGPGT